MRNYVYEMKWSWHNWRHYPGVSLEGWEDHRTPQPGWPASGPKFQPWTFQNRSRISARSAATFAETSEIIIKIARGLRYVHSINMFYYENVLILCRLSTM
jgi:hypothetical protein